MPAYVYPDSTSDQLLTKSGIQTVTGTKTFEAGTLTGPGTKKTVRVPHTFAIGGPVMVDNAANDYYIPPFFVSVPAGQTVSLVGMRTVIKSGTSATIRVWIENLNTTGTVAVDMTPFGGFAVTPTKTTTMFSPAGAVEDNFAVGIEVSAVSGTPKNMSVTLFLEYTV